MSSPRSRRKQGELRHGFTTGACAAAAALGAAMMLRDGCRHNAVQLPLPAGFVHRFALAGTQCTGQNARCFVVKDAGDDPDVTHGVQVHAEVAWSDRAEGLVIEGGLGIGRVTKQGLAVAVGQWAINPVPMKMIEEAVGSVFPSLPPGRGLRVTISIPDGEERARRTLNDRLGIIGGLSILGTTGVVRPISHRAWTDTLDVALDVAAAGNCPAVVLSTGRSSEVVAQQAIDLPEEAFVMMGDHVGYAMEACHRKGWGQVVLAVQFAKLVKIACGHPQTHVHSSRLDLARLARWGEEAGLDPDAVKKIECANTAREVFEALEGRDPLLATVAREGLEQCRKRAPGSRVAILLVGYDGREFQRYGDWPELTAGGERR